MDEHTYIPLSGNGPRERSDSRNAIFTLVIKSNFWPSTEESQGLRARGTRLNRKSPARKSETSKHKSGDAAFRIWTPVATLVAVASNVGPIHWSENASIWHRGAHLVLLREREAQKPRALLEAAPVGLVHRKEWERKGVWTK